MSAGICIYTVQYAIKNQPGLVVDDNANLKMCLYRSCKMQVSIYISSGSFGQSVPFNFPLSKSNKNSHIFS